LGPLTKAQLALKHTGGGNRNTTAAEQKDSGQVSHLVLTPHEEMSVCFWWKCVSLCVSHYRELSQVQLPY